ncbi:GGDEF domain-containing protein [Paenibacillus sepulcri]|uniref:GGDEF domain-containing protein n=1 Tax=Paenibacillus sepulcri TaxID=359917 RepID=A0ABS7C8A4_9BACL|nr:GGDEF domain-containing protein [Paenibacillus sepulcri]
MDDIGYGLLDRTMIHRITERWHHGGIGVIIMHLPVSGAAVLEALQTWVTEQKRLIWRYRMESDFFFFFQRSKSDERLDLLLENAVNTLRQQMMKVVSAAPEGRVQQRMAIGSASVLPSGLGRSAEAMVYHAIKEALVSVMRYRLRDESAAAREVSYQEAEARPYLRVENGLDYNDGDMSYSIGALAKTIPTFRTSARVSEVARMFEENQHLQGAIVVNQERPVGLVMKEKMHQMLAGQFGLPLYWNRSIEKMMDDDALVVDAELPVEQVAQMAMGRDISRLYVVVTITRDGKLLGAASIRSILEFMTNLRTEEARTANPLTGLPGNGAIQREIKRRIDAGKPFCMIYADLDYFKWFNDCFGFSQGDELIRFLAEVLQEIPGRENGGKGDFVGHIGGDDFIVLSDHPQPEKLCIQILERFDGGVKFHYGGSDVSMVIDRSGNKVEQEGVSLSLSLLLWDADCPITPGIVSQAAARLKKQAKAIKGSAYISGEVIEKQPGEERL